MSLPCKPGYLRLTDHSNSTTLELIPYESFMLRPEIRKGLLAKISAQGCYLCCACQAAGAVPIEIYDDLSYSIPETGHMPECGFYLRRIQSIVDFSYLRECLEAEPTYRVSFKTADRKRFVPKLDCLDSYDLDGVRNPNMGLRELVGIAVSRAYNRAVEARSVRGGTSPLPLPNSILGALEIEFNLMRIRDADGTEVSLSDMICDPNDRKPGETSFLVGRINAVRISEKNATLYCAVSHKGWVGSRELAITVTRKEWEGFILSHSRLTGGNLEGRFRDLHIAGFVKHYERKFLQSGRYNSRTHSRYSSGDEGSGSYMLTQIRGAVFFTLSSYGMLVSYEKQGRLSDAYNQNGFCCIKPLLPVPCLIDVPDMVIPNPCGPDLVVVYPYAAGAESNAFVKILNY